MGQPVGSAARTCLVAVGLARATGCDEATASDVYFASLLQHVGCTAYSHEASLLFADERRSNARRWRPTSHDRARWCGYLPSIVREAPAGQRLRTARAERPHRPAGPPARAAGRLRAMAKARQLDHDAVEAVLAAAADEGVKAIFDAFHQAFAGFTGHIHDQVAELDRVVTRKTFRGRHVGDFMGVSATGIDVHIDVIDIVRIADGQIVEHWNVVDQLGLMRQLGAPRGG